MHLLHQHFGILRRILPAFSEWRGRGGASLEASRSTRQRLHRWTWTEVRGLPRFSGLHGYASEPLFLARRTLVGSAGWWVFAELLSSTERPIWRRKAAEVSTAGGPRPRRADPICMMWMDTNCGPIFSSLRHW